MGRIINWIRTRLDRHTHDVKFEIQRGTGQEINLQTQSQLDKAIRDADNLRNQNDALIKKLHTKEKEIAQLKKDLTKAQEVALFNADLIEGQNSAITMNLHTKEKEITQLKKDLTKAQEVAQRSEIKNRKSWMKNHKQEIAQLKENHKQEIAQLKENHKQEITYLKEDWAMAKIQIKEDYANLLEETKIVIAPRHHDCNYVRIQITYEEHETVDSVCALESKTSTLTFASGVPDADVRIYQLLRHACS